MYPSLNEYFLAAGVIPLAAMALSCARWNCYFKPQFFVFGSHSALFSLPKATKSRTASGNSQLSLAGGDLVIEAFRPNLIKKADYNANLKP